MLNKFKMTKKKYIGNYKFYSEVFSNVIPMILQSFITNLINMIENIMIGRIGTEQMNGVSIVNQLIYILNITILGAIAGSSIFGTQFFGKGDHNSQKYTFRFRIISITAIIVITTVLLYIFNKHLILIFLHNADSLQIAATLRYGSEYITIILISFIPFGIGQVYSSLVRECGETKIPLLGSLFSIGINILLDYCLIFGKFGMPKFGVKGAAMATVISKTIEAIVVIVWTHTHPLKNKYIVSAFKSFKIPSSLTINIIKKVVPMILNELIWSIGMAIITQCYSVRGLDVMAARNISKTIIDLLSSIYIQMGACISLCIGAKLGAGKLNEARILNNKLRFLSVLLTTIVTIIVFPLITLFPKFYNTSNEIRSLASFMIFVQFLVMPLLAYNDACYFTLRSSGKIVCTFFFDLGFSWLLMIPLAWILANLSFIDIYLMYTIVTFSEVIKVIIGYFMIKSGIWINTLIN